MYTAFKTASSAKPVNPLPVSLMDSTKMNDIKASDSVEENIEITERWKKEQDELRAKMIETNTEEWQKLRVMGDEGLCRIAGVDISFVKNDLTNACASVVVLQLPSLDTLYSKCEMIELTAPYIPGYLAFREVPHIVKLIEEIPSELRPQLIMVDGNGKLHYRCFGSACHLGVLLDIPTIGVAKNLLMLDGIERDDVVDKFIASCSKKGDSMDIIGKSGTIYGKVYQSTERSGRHPIYVSIGHRISLDTAIWVVDHCCPYRIPQPIRQADLSSRKYLRTKFRNGDSSAATERITEAMENLNVQD